MRFALRIVITKVHTDTETVFGMRDAKSHFCPDVDPFGFPIHAGVEGNGTGIADLQRLARQQADTTTGNIVDTDRARYGVMTKQSRGNVKVLSKICPQFGGGEQICLCFRSHYASQKVFGIQIGAILLQKLNAKG